MHVNGSCHYATTVGKPGAYGIRVGTLAERRQLRPKQQGWCRSALDWVMNLEALPQTAQQIRR